MKKYVESAQRRQERIANYARLSTKTVESKKVYNRNKAKQKLRKEEY